MELKRRTNPTLGGDSWDGNFERFLLFYLSVFLEMYFTMSVALAGMAQWIECWTAN